MDSNQVFDGPWAVMCTQIGTLFQAKFVLPCLRDGVAMEVVVEGVGDLVTARVQPRPPLPVSQ